MQEKDASGVVNGVRMFRHSGYGEGVFLPLDKINSKWVGGEPLAPQYDVEESTVSVFTPCPPACVWYHNIMGCLYNK